jgi:hypothetical protein
MRQRKTIKVKCRFCRQLVEVPTARPDAKVVCASCLSSLSAQCRHGAPARQEGGAR